MFDTIAACCGSTQSLHYSASDNGQGGCGIEVASVLVSQWRLREVNIVVVDSR